MSRALERLRVVLADELLVRRDGTYELTPRAEHLRTELADLLPQLDTAIRGHAFKPAESHERFRVVTHEYSSLVLMPSIVRAVSVMAPHSIVETDPWHAGAVAQIEAGSVDLAISGLDLTAGLTLSPLFSDDLVCIVADDHPLRGPRLSLASYVMFPHVSIGIENGRQPWIDGPLLSRGLARRIAYRTHSIAAGSLAVPGTQMILTTGRRWFEACGHFLGLRALDAPRELNPFLYGMAWHPRLSGHPAHAWFRNLVTEAARTLFSDRGHAETASPDTSPEEHTKAPIA